MLVRDVIRNREPYSTRASATVQEAAEFMADRNIGAVCVLDERGKLLGVFSERDVMNRVVVPKTKHPTRPSNEWSKLEVDIFPWSTAIAGSACFRCAICSAWK